MNQGRPSEILRELARE